jgi:hypothetical protein
MKLPPLLSLLCALSMTSSCASQKASGPSTNTVAIDPKAACLVWRPILFSRLHDTDETIRQAKELNAAHDAFCAEGK